MPATNADIEQVIPLVHSLVHKHFEGVPACVADHDDLFQVAMEAVCRCARRWNPERGKFATFAFPRAHGAIQDYLRAERPGSRFHPMPHPRSLEEEITTGPEGETTRLHDTIPFHDPEPEDDAWTGRLFAEVDRLPELQRRRLRLIVEAEMSLTEVADIEGVSIAAVSHSMRFARENLAPRFKALGVAA